MKRPLYHKPSAWIRERRESCTKMIRRRQESNGFISLACYLARCAAEGRRPSMAKTFQGTERWTGRDYRLLLPAVQKVAAICMHTNIIYKLI
ncbi:MAG: hypothetical protein A4E19_05245 [Nitrospira sp. SG-bin1]|nr:MAG: hypothetical protein A4E19_05245 [Nitrospira sp. SG-bin1]